MGGWFRKEINSAADLKGLKMRIPGLGGDVMAKLGASPVSLPGGQIYENLVSGAIDATEWVGPWNDKFMKFYEAAKYYYYPGMHEPGATLSLGMNASWWGKLSKNDQIIVEAVAVAETDIMMAEFNAKSGKALQELVKDHGVKLRQFNDDVYDAFGKGAEEVFETTRAHSALAKEVDESFRKARADLGPDAIVGSFCGASRHEGLVAGENGADYVSFGPVGQTGLGDGTAADPELFQWWSEMIEVPVVAEGGLTDTLVRRLAPIADFLALGEEVWTAEDPLVALKSLAAARS